MILNGDFYYHEGEKNLSGYCYYSIQDEKAFNNFLEASKNIMKKKII
jgi:hypothetical protein